MTDVVYEISKENESAFDGYIRGYVRRVLVFPRFDKASMAELSKSIKNVLAENDGSIPMVALPPAVLGAGEQKAQFIPLTNDVAGGLMVCGTTSEMTH